MTPIRLAARTALKPIKVGHDPDEIVITPDGKTAYVINSGSGTVTPIQVATGKALKAIRVGFFTSVLAMTPDGKIVYALGSAAE